MNSDSIRQQYLALVRAMGFADFSDRSQVEILGKDRAQVLQGLCTNDIKKLKPGEGCEAFLTNVQGKTIGFVYVFCTPNSLVLDSVAGQSQSIIRNLDRYVIREDVKFVDRTSDWCEYLVSGPLAPMRLMESFQIETPSRALQHEQVRWRDSHIYVRRVPFTTADCFFLVVERSLASDFSAELAKQNVLTDIPAIAIARIEAGTPLFGQDVTEDNLPQEVDRTSQAISFTKGCYLGQETVARLDALGHVNRTLCGVKFSGPEVPTPGTEIRIDDKVACRVTSSCWSIRLDAPLALAYVRRGFNQMGARFQTDWGEAEVVPLPLA